MSRKWKRPRAVPARNDPPSVKPPPLPVEEEIPQLTGTIFNNISGTMVMCGVRLTYEESPITILCPPLPTVLEHESQQFAPQSEMRLLEPEMGVSGKTKQIALLNGKFSIVKPVTAYTDLQELWQKNVQACAGLHLSRLPGQGEYQLVSRSTVYVAAFAHGVKPAAMERWLVPVGVRSSGTVVDEHCGGEFTYGRIVALMPAKYLLMTQDGLDGKVATQAPPTVEEPAEPTEYIPVPPPYRMWSLQD